VISKDINVFASPAQRPDEGVYAARMGQSFEE
jgi:hypothetical protein